MVIFSDFGDMCHCGLPVSQAMGMIWVSKDLIMFRPCLEVSYGELHPCEIHTM